MKRETIKYLMNRGFRVYSSNNNEFISEVGEDLNFSQIVKMSEVEFGVELRIEGKEVNIAIFPRKGIRNQKELDNLQILLNRTNRLVSELKEKYL